MDQAAMKAGDAMKDLLHRAVVALVNDDEKALWQVLDHDAWSVVREWDRACGRTLDPTDEEAREGQKVIDQMIADYRSRHPDWLPPKKA